MAGFEDLISVFSVITLGWIADEIRDFISMLTSAISALKKIYSRPTPSASATRLM